MYHPLCFKRVRHLHVSLRFDTTRFVSARLVSFGDDSLLFGTTCYVPHGRERCRPLSNANTKFRKDVLKKVLRSCHVDGVGVC